jgi:NitT/TauT family transport system permease protein
MSTAKPIQQPDIIAALPFLLRLRHAFSSWAGLFAIAVIWEISAQISNLTWLPPLSRVLARLAELFITGDITPHLAQSFGSLLLGFGIALAIGLAIGLAMGLNKWIYTALDSYVNALLFTPGLIFAPILFAIFGLSYWTRVSVVVIYATFIIVINTAAAVRNVERPLIEMAASYGASRFTTLCRIVFPDAFPLIVAGIRMGVGRAVKGMVNGEIFISLVGIGGLVSRYGKQFDFTSVWALSLFIMLLAVLINKGVSLVERRLTQWID